MPANIWTTIVDDDGKVTALVFSLYRDGQYEPPIFDRGVCDGGLLSDHIVLLRRGARIRFKCLRKKQYIVKYISGFDEEASVMSFCSLKEFNKLILNRPPVVERKLPGWF